VSAGRISIVARPRGGATYPATSIATTVASLPAVISGATLLQTLGAFSGTQAVAVPALAANVPHDLTFAFALTSFPSPFSLASGATGLVLGTVALVTTPASATTLVGLPALSLTFGTGGTTVPGSGQWTLTGGGAYQGLQLRATVRVFSPSATAAQTLTFLGQALLLGLPPA